jgi:hypothetical protein
MTQFLLPFVNFCGRYSSVCPLITPSSAPGITFCPRCLCVAPILIAQSS